MSTPILKCLFVFNASFLALLLCSCSTTLLHDMNRAAGASGDSDDTLIIAVADATASLDPARAFENISSMIHKATYDTLVTFPADSVDTIVPALAESWDVSDDNLIYTFRLREDAVFNDGSPVTADDVVFSFDRLKQVRGNPSFLAETIESVEALDNRTVKIRLTRPDPAILAKLVHGAFSIINREEAIAHGAADAWDVITIDSAEAWLNQQSAGSGPYVLTRWEPGVEVVLERNDHYWDEPATIRRIVLRNIPQAASQKLQLEAGEIDIALDLMAAQVSSLANNPEVVIHEALSDMLLYLKGNQDPSIGGALSDPLVMAAIRYALDYDGIRLLAGGESATPASMLPIGFPGANEANSGLARDVEQARRLLAKAGYLDDLQLTLTYPDLTFAGVDFGTFAQKIQADLAEAGIDVLLQPTEVGVALEAYRQGKEPFGLWIRLSDYRDSVNFVEFLPDGVIGKRLNWQDENADDDILALRDALKHETDDEVRDLLFKEMQDYLLARGPYAALLQPGIQIGLRRDVDGFVYHPQWTVDLALLKK